MDEDYENALRNWIDRMTKEDRDLLLEIILEWKKEHEKH